MVHIDKSEFAVKWDELMSLKGDEPDFTIAAAYADHRLADCPRRRFHFSILLEKGQPSPLSCNWHRKGAVGLKTDNRKLARDWIIQALLLGFTVFNIDTHMGSGIAGVRRQLREAAGAPS